MFRIKTVRILVLILLLSAAAYILTPRFWEPTGESWKQWAAARILRDTGGFPVFSLGPLYVVYLQIFSFLDYPCSIQLEYVVTHMFTYLAIFLMLAGVLPRAIALVLTLAWLPLLSVTEGGGVVAGIGCLALYLRGAKDYAERHEYLPVPLFAASLCHSAYAFFLFGHMSGIAFKKIRQGVPLIRISSLGRNSGFLSLALKIILSAIVVLTILLPSRRIDHNHMVSDSKYAPVAYSDALTIGFFQIGNWKYVMRNLPRDSWINQDWHFTNDKAFGGAKTILQALIKRPDTAIRNFLGNTGSLVRLPLYFFTARSNYQFGLIFIPLFIIGMIGLFKGLYRQALPALFSIVVGSLAGITALLLTWFNTRYIISLLPAGLLVVAYSGKAFQDIFAKKNMPYLGSCVILISAILVLSAAQYPDGRKAQLQAVLGNRGFLRGVKPVSMADAYPKLAPRLKENTKILSLEDHWLKAFTKVGLDNIYSVFSLPPFEDKSAQELLDRVDEIWVSYDWSSCQPSVATQAYLRYRLYVLPLVDKVRPKSWRIEDIKGYGQVFLRP